MGYKPYGGPDLTDDVWIYGGDRGAITASISAGRMGRCPAWVDKLDAATIKVARRLPLAQGPRLTSGPVGGASAARVTMTPDSWRVPRAHSWGNRS